MTTITSSRILRFVALAAATAAGGALVAGCDRDKASVTHTTIAGQAIDATQQGTKIAVTLDGKSVEVPGPYTCGATGGMTTVASALGKTPAVIFAVQQGTTNPTMVTVTPEQGKSYTWATGSPKGNVSITRSDDTFTVTGKLSEMAFDSAAALHDFKIEATCPGMK